MLTFRLAIRCLLYMHLFGRFLPLQPRGFRQAICHVPDLPSKDDLVRPSYSEGVINPQSVCQNEDPTAFPHCPAWMLIISLGMIFVVDF